MFCLHQISIELKGRPAKTIRKSVYKFRGHRDLGSEQFGYRASYFRSLYSTFKLVFVNIWYMGDKLWMAFRDGELALKHIDRDPGRSLKLTRSDSKPPKFRRKRHGKTGRIGCCQQLFWVCPYSMFKPSGEGIWCLQRQEKSSSKIRTSRYSLKQSLSQ